MKKLLLMMACFVGLACYSVGGNDSAAAVTADQTVQTVSAVAAEPNIWLEQAYDGWYLNVTGNDRPVYVVVDGPNVSVMRWEVPPGGTRMLVYGNVPILTIAEWGYLW